MLKQSLFGLALACAATPCAALAQTAYLEASGIVGQGTKLSISRLPVADASGKITYWDVALGFAVSSAGVPSLAAPPVFTHFPKLVTSHFIAGRYYVKDGGAATQFGSLTDGVGSGGATIWSLTMDQAPDGGFPDQASWQTGAPAPDVAARLANAKVPYNPNYSYGITAVGGFCYTAFCQNNGLLAAEQVADTLILISYTGSTGGDQAQQTGSIVLGLCKDSSCSNAPK